MALTFSIRKGYEILLEVTVCEKVISKDTLIPHLIQKCFERIFQVIEYDEKRENEVILGEESEEEDSME